MIGAFFDNHVADNHRRTSWSTWMSPLRNWRIYYTRTTLHRDPILTTMIFEQVDSFVPSAIVFSDTIKSTQGDLLSDETKLPFTLFVIHPQQQQHPIFIHQTFPYSIMYCFTCRPSPSFYWNIHHYFK